MKKTAMQLHIEQLEEQKKRVPVEAYQKGLDYAIQAAKLKLETERENLEEAYKADRDNADSAARQYYKETYG